MWGRRGPGRETPSAAAAGAGPPFPLARRRRALFWTLPKGLVPAPTFLPSLSDSRFFLGTPLALVQRPLFPSRALLAVSALSPLLSPSLYFWARQHVPLPQSSEALTCLWLCRCPSLPGARSSWPPRASSPCSRRLSFPPCSPLSLHPASSTRPSLWGPSTSPITALNSGLGQSRGWGCPDTQERHPGL